ncbi:MAG: response regulator transcription factor [Anaerolineae bacterium]|nr:response regulator transcription factor [Anaerolineae bacterium]
MRSPAVIRVLIVDDHGVVRRGLRAYLDPHPDFDVAGEANSGAAAVQLAAELAPDVILMDLAMPGMDGVEATRRLKAAHPQMQIVVLTSFHHDEHIFPALQAGATSYVLKDIAMEDLAETLRLAARGEASLHPRVAARVIQEVRGPRSETVNPFTELTERELDVLKLIAAGLGNRKIAETLFISENTVKGYVSNILSKLHLNDRTEAAVYAWQTGIVRRDPTGTLPG